MKVQVDTDSCTGCGVCTDLVPKVFELNDDNLCVAKSPNVPADLEEQVQEASDSCPVSCITVS